MLYTGKGDDGATKLFGCDQRISKSSAISEALGVTDETNSLLGVLKMRAGGMPAIQGLTYYELLDDVQQDIFVVQAQLAGAEKHINKAHVEKVEKWVKLVEEELPPITSFFVSGGTEIGALCDYARTVARRAERRVVAAMDEGMGNEKPPMLAYMNRLSSLLYALARLANHRAGITEEKPHY